MNLNKSKPKRNGILSLALITLGVVFGDIGTSPLYAFRECFSLEHNIPVTDHNVLGLLSLIFWSLIIVISIKYIIYVMRADNQGEGGILSLLTLIISNPGLKGKSRQILFIAGLFASALFYGDGMITPAISVLSAVEGLKIATPIFDPYIIPIAILILISLFLIQSRGTSLVGSVFGPLMMLWFIVLSILGIRWIVEAPGVLWSVNPVHAIDFFANKSFTSFTVLGAVFLVVTGGEALYADIGHFGKLPIRLTWFIVVLPSLLLNYFGQGALLIANPKAIENPFFYLAPGWSLYPLIGLATFATIIASQAVISGAFSLTYQAIQLGYFPRLEILHTSREKIGQVYIPAVNWILLIGTVSLVVTFHTSDNLAGAYGVAIATLMVVTSVLMFTCSRICWGWKIITALVVTGIFLIVDLSFFGANIFKVAEGGWVPLAIAVLVYFVMTTWIKGRKTSQLQLEKDQISYDELDSILKKESPVSVPGTAVYLAGNPKGIPETLLKNIKYNKVIHENVVILNIVTEKVPHVSRDKSLEIEKKSSNITKIIAHFGYIGNPNVPALLRLAEEKGVRCSPEDARYFLGGANLVISNSTEISRFRKLLFIFLAKNADAPAEHFNLPPERTIEIGTLVKI